MPVCRRLVDGVGRHRRSARACREHGGATLGQTSSEMIRGDISHHSLSSGVLPSHSRLKSRDRFGIAGSHHVHLPIGELHRGPGMRDRGQPKHRDPGQLQICFSHPLPQEDRTRWRNRHSRAQALLASNKGTPCDLRRVFTEVSYRG